MNIQSPSGGRETAMAEGDDSESQQLLFRPPAAPDHAFRRSPTELFRNFLFFGLVSFGGPNAHISFLLQKYVEQKKWLPAAVFQEMLSVCQSIPGPTSTQMTAGIGLLSGGLPGLLITLSLFLLPGAITMGVMGWLLSSHADKISSWRDDSTVFQGITNGLIIAAIATIAVAAMKLAKRALTDRYCIVVCCISCVVAVLASQFWWIYPLIFVLAGSSSVFYLRKFKSPAPQPQPSQATVAAEDDVLLQIPTDLVSRPVAIGCVVGYVALLVSLMAIRRTSLGEEHPMLVYCEIFLRVGSLIFGGGHVVIPELTSELVAGGLLSSHQFLESFVLVSLLPGAMFNMSVCLGMILDGIRGAILCWICLFLPGILLLIAALHFWAEFRKRAPAIAEALYGINAAALGLIIAAMALLWAEMVGSDANKATIFIAAYLIHGVFDLDVPFAIVTGAACGLVLRTTGLTGK